MQIHTITIKTKFMLEFSNAIIAMFINLLDFIYLDNEQKYNCLVDKIVFFSIILDAKLQWGPHIAGLANRLSFAAYTKFVRSLTKIQHE